jgi:hypothetical protein
MFALRHADDLPCLLLIWCTKGKDLTGPKPPSLFSSEKVDQLVKACSSHFHPRLFPRTVFWVTRFGDGLKKTRHGTSLIISWRSSSLSLCVYVCGSILACVLEGAEAFLKAIAEGQVIINNPRCCTMTISILYVPFYRVY